ncbi:MAG: LamG domain-containing protein [Rhodocyclaceae bacterium]|nr:MAG: LamG domain-containing protein [Rhodocyclaceae bacterium]
MHTMTSCSENRAWPLLLMLFAAAVLLLPPEEAFATMPAYRASGTFTFGPGTITPPYPPTMAANDVCLLAVESENQAIALTTANGFVQVPTWSPQSAGTAATNPASRLALYWKRTLGGDTAPLVADSGDHTTGQIHCFSGVITSGNPWDTGAGGNDGGANDTSATIPGSTTTSHETLVVLITSTSRNGTSTANCSAWTNADLTSLTPRTDNTNTINLGGGHCMATGVKAVAGAYTTTTVTLANTSYKGAISLALKPVPVTTLADGTDPANAAIAPSATATMADAFTFQTNTGTDVITVVVVGLGSGVFGGLSLVEITDDAGTTVYGSVADPASDTPSITLATNTLTATTTATQYNIRVTPKSHATMPSPPGATYSVTAKINSWSGTNSNAGTDTAGTTVTIDNLSPAGATTVSGSAGAAQVTLNWTTSASSDFSRSVVLRWTGGTAGSDVPAEGTNYVNGNTIGIASPGNPATVVCVRTADAVSTAVSGVDGAGTGGCGATALASGQDYTYKVFQQDANGNYDGGVAMGTFTTLPSVVSINCAVSCAATSAATVSWTVTFSTSVTGVDATAFSLVPGGGLTGAYITTVTGGGTSWTVTANTGIGSGSLGLNQTGAGSVVPTLTGTFTGQVYTTVAISALAEYRMDEASWNGTANEVTDSGPGGYNGTAAGLTTRPTTSGTSPAIAGSPGTCRYGAFTRSNKDYIELPAGFPNLAAAAGGFTITAWINVATNTLSGQRIFIDDQNNTSPGGWGFSVGETATAGGLRFYYRQPSVYILDTAPIPSDQWLFVALSVQLAAGANASTATIYAYDTAGALVTSNTSTFTWTAGSDPGPSSIGGETNASGEGSNAFGFGGNLDEVRVYQKTLSQAAVQAIAAQTRTCAITVDHVAINAPASAATLTDVPVTITPHNAAHTPLALGSSINLSTSTASGDWNIGTGTGTLTPGAANSGLATYTFGAGETSVTLDFNYQTAGTVTINVTDASTGTNLLSNTPSPSELANTISFTASSFVFTDSACVNGAAFGAPGCVILSWSPQVAGQNVAGVYITAVNGGVPTRLSNRRDTTRTIQFGLSCHNPAADAGKQATFGGITLPLCAANVDPPTVWSSALSVTFLRNEPSAGPYIFNYADVGAVNLWMQDTPTRLGASGTFVVKPGGFVLSGIKRTSDGVANPAAVDAAGTAFVKAGEAFSVTVTATTIDGVTATPNYGQEMTAESVKLTSAVVTGLGLTHDLTTVGGTFGPFTNGVATGTAFTWDEVGIIKLTPSVASASYLGAGDVTGTVSGNVGRFYAAKFVLAPSPIANRTGLGGTCAAPVGCDTFTYLGEQMSAVFTLTAKAVDGTTTLQNYTAANGFAKLNPLAAVTAGTGGPLGFGAVNSAAARTPFPPCAVTPAHPCLTPAQAATGTFASGGADVSVPLTIYRNTAQVGPYDLLDVGIAPQDSDAAIMAAYDLDTINVVVGTPNHTLIGQTRVRYGRLQIENMYGPPSANMATKVRALYWDGTQWALNTADTISGALPSGVPTDSFALSTTTPACPVNGATISSSSATSAGEFRVVLTPPSGSVRRCVVLETSASLSPYLPGSGRETWGTFRAPYIYQRER